MSSEPSSHWQELSKRFYKFHHFNPISGEQKSLLFEGSRIAIARWGGPMAAMKNLEVINLMKADDILKDSIVFFSNSGKIIQKVQYKDFERVVLFDFLEDELLVVIKTQGQYYVIDPFKGTKRLCDLGDQFRSDPIVSGQVVGNGLVIQTSSFEFYHIPNAQEPQLIKMKATGLKQQPDYWLAIPNSKSSSGKVEVQITNPDGGIIHLIEDEKVKIYYNRDQDNYVQLPDLKNIKMISFSPSYKFVSYLQFINQQWTMSVLQDDFEGTNFYQIQLDLKEDDYNYEGPIKDKSVLERPKKMSWCGDDCVVLQLSQTIVMIGPDSSQRVKLSNKHFAIQAEIDGLRIINQKKNEILRRLPDSFVSVFQPLSTQPGAMLYAAYESFASRNPIEDDELRSKKQDLAQGVQDCISAGKFEVSPEYQTKLLKAASYGKTFLGNQAIDPNLLSETCRFLRVVNAMRRSGGVGGRVLTYDQVYQMTKLPQLFVTLMLRYNLHYLAVEVTRYLKFQPKYRSQIYTHWACCKVQTQIDDETLSQQIKEKIKEEKGVSFTEIAHRAIEEGKAQLALKLLENEPSLAKRIPVLLWMASYQQDKQGNINSYYEKALYDAVASRDSNLIYLVIMKFLKASVDDNYIFGILTQSPIIQAHLITYLRNFDDAKLQKYFQYLKKYDECGLLAVTQAYQKQNLGDKIKVLEIAQKFFEDDSKDSFYGKIVAEQLSSLNDLKQELDKDKKKNNKKVMDEKPLNAILESFLLKDDLKIAGEFAKHYKIPERRFQLTRVKALIQNKNYDELDRLVNEINKKTQFIPYELVADLLIRSGAEDKGLAMIMKMPEVEEQVYLFMKIGQMRYAVQCAINNKKYQLLKDLRGQVQEPALIAQIEAFLQQSGK
ncbi:hypothetical protein pb186bvf_003704 [Paramecium bursaria]